MRTQCGMGKGREREDPKCTRSRPGRYEATRGFNSGFRRPFLKILKRSGLCGMSFFLCRPFVRPRTACALGGAPFDCSLGCRWRSLAALLALGAESMRGQARFGRRAFTVYLCTVRGPGAGKGRNGRRVLLLAWALFCQKVRLPTSAVVV